MARETLVTLKARIAELVAENEALKSTIRTQDQAIATLRKASKPASKPAGKASKPAGKPAKAVSTNTVTMTYAPQKRGSSYSMVVCFSDKPSQPVLDLLSSARLKMFKSAGTYYHVLPIRDTSMADHTAGAMAGKFGLDVVRYDHDTAVLLDPIFELALASLND